MAQKRITDLSAASTVLGTELIEVSQLSTTIKIVAGTISALASDNSFNDSAAGFITAGFAVADRVRVSGFTGNVANNILVGVITALTTGKMTIGGTDGDVIVDDAAGETVTITKWTSRRATASEIVALAAQSGAAVQTEAADYTIDPAGAGHYIRLTGATAKVVNIALDSTTALPANAEWHFRNVGAGDATITPVGGVTVNAPNGGTLVIPQDGTVTLKRAAADVFDLLGQTVAL